MVNARLTEEMTKKMRRLVGHQFVSYSMDDDIFDDKSYCKIRITTDAICLDVMNEVQAFPFLESSIGTTEELSCFTCRECSVNTKYEPYLLDVKSKEVLVNEIIQGMSIVSDEIIISEENYAICLDMAIIVETNRHKYVFSRRSYFDEQIYIHIDKDFDTIYSISDVQKSWNNEGEFSVQVKRLVTKL